MSDPTGLRGLIEDYAEARGVLGSREGGLGDTTTEAHVDAAMCAVREEWATLDAALTAVETLVQAAEALSAQHEQDALDFSHGLSGRLPRYAGEVQAIRDALAAVRERGLPASTDTED